MAGKTTILKVLTRKEVLKPKPTFGYDVEEVNYHGMRFTAFDLGGQEVFVHALWKKMMLQCDAIVFVVDAASDWSLQKAQQLIDFIAGWIPKVPFVLLANKQDLPNARSAEEILLQLNLGEIFFDIGVPHFRIFSTSAVTGVGIEEAFTWLFEQLGGHLSIDASKILKIILYDTTSGLPLAALVKGRALSNQGTNDQSDTNGEIIEIDLSSWGEASTISAIYSAMEIFSRQIGAEGLNNIILEAKSTLGKDVRIVSAKKGSRGCLLLCDVDMDPLAARKLGMYLLDALEKYKKDVRSSHFSEGDGGVVIVNEDQLMEAIKAALFKYLRFSPANEALQF